jgi:orotate phosphoribosyltransferase
MTEASSFIELALASRVLQFGEFTLKSGRVSPYFFNAGLFQDGASLSSLGGFYARRMLNSGLDFDVLFGPPYKGIPLVSTMSVALARDHGVSMPYAYARKEVKDHGEGGQLVGAPLKGRVLIVDDVVTAGTAANEAIQMILAAGAEPAGVLVAIDRQERGADGSMSAVQSLEATHGIPVLSIVTFSEIVDYVRRSQSEAEIERMLAYRDAYGI